MKTFACVVVAGLATSAGAELTTLGATNILTAETLNRNAELLNFTTANRTSSGDSYTSETLIQTAGGAFFLDDTAGSSFIVDAAPADGGQNLTYTTPVSMTTVAADLDNGDGTRTALVQTTALDAAGASIAWVPAGVTNGGDPFVAWRMDVGTTAGGVDGLDIALNPGESVNFLGSGFAAFDSTGGVLGVFALTLDDSAGSTASGLAVIGIGGADIAGFDLAAIQLFWDYEIVPAPASLSMIALGGLVAARRRR